jgi:hypothetical protein
VNEILNVNRGNLVFSVPVLESIVSGHGLQVVRVPADDLRFGLRIVLLPCCDVNIENRKRFRIN